jgi:hypothetical protein
MTEPRRRLYDLLPEFHRIRDEQVGSPLRDLLDVIGAQVQLVEDDISRQYDNWFIETCEDWVVPYIGDLVGYRAIASAGDGVELRRALTPRAEVANVIPYRRRKGTFALLELLANGAGWPARAVEFYTLLAWTQNIRHLRPGRGRTVDLRDGDALERFGGPFDALAHGIDIRRPGSSRTKGRYNLASVAAFIWPLGVYSLTGAPPRRAEGAASNCFTFSVLGNDTPLHVRPVPEEEPTQIAGEFELPVPIRRRMLRDQLNGPGEAGGALYGPGKSLAIYAPDWPSRGGPELVPASAIEVADLSRWRHRPKTGQVLLDPVRGRMMFPERDPPKRVRVDYHHAFGGEIGGGEYRRPLQQPAKCRIYKVRRRRHGAKGTERPLTAALEKWRTEAEELARDGIGAVIEIEDSADYAEPVQIELPAGASLQIRAALGARPSIRLLDYGADQIDALIVSGKAGSRLVLDGLLISGRGIHVVGPNRRDAAAIAEGDLCDLVIRQSTLVPGWSIDTGCRPAEQNEPSIALIDTRASVTISHSIVGTIQVAADEVTNDPVTIRISDSIVDATDPDLEAVAGSSLPIAFARMTILRSTVFGTLGAHAVELAENSIFLGQVKVARRQVGCVRYCYVPPGSRTPRRYGCQPDGAAGKAGPGAPGGALRVRPAFASMRYGAPAYGRLAPDCAPEIRRGADDESEMGVFHDLFEPQRTERLEARLTEYSPADYAAEIILAS